MAVTIFQTLADNDFSPAQYMLAKYYANDLSVTKSPETVFKWYEKAAIQGDADAQYNLAVCYKSGDGVIKDSKTAFEWYGKSAIQGNAVAQNNLAWCYQNGKGVKRDLTKAIQLYLQSIDNGYQNSAYALSRLISTTNGFKAFQEHIKTHLLTSLPFGVNIVSPSKLEIIKLTLKINQLEINREVEHALQTIDWPRYRDGKDPYFPQGVDRILLEYVGAYVQPIKRKTYNPTSSDSEMKVEHPSSNNSSFFSSSSSSSSSNTNTHTSDNEKNSDNDRGYEETDNTRPVKRGRK